MARIRRLARRSELRDAQRGESIGKLKVCSERFGPEGRPSRGLEKRTTIIIMVLRVTLLSFDL